jgi:hypothetical protein
MSDGMIRIMCPNLKCRRILAVPTSARGKTVRCRNCGSTVKVPEPASKTAAGEGVIDASEPTVN